MLQQMSHRCAGQHLARPVSTRNALYEALRDGQIFAQAGCDRTRPYDGQPLLTSITWCRPAYCQRSIYTRTNGPDAAENHRGLKGERLPNCVNPEVYRRPVRTLFWVLFFAQREKNTSNLKVGNMFAGCLDEKNRVLA